jgi:hypothetical protein
MIIDLNSYRKTAGSYSGETAASRRLFGNTVPKLSLREIEEDARRSASPQLPDDFDDFDTRSFILNARDLASQI